MSEPRISVSRRTFLAGTAASVAASVVLARPTATGATTPNKTLLTVFLRGGVDGLTLLAPLGDAAYADARGPLAVSAAGARPLAGPRPDRFFAFHPHAASLASLYAQGRVAVVPAAGLPAINRSHFDAQLQMESAGFGHAHGTGWAGRWLDVTGRGDDHVLRATSFSASPPMVLRGYPAICAHSIEDVTLLSWGPDRNQVRRNVAGATTHPLLASSMGPALDTLDHLVDSTAVTRPSSWPTTALGTRMWAVTRLLAAGMPVTFAHIDHEGWDTHADQGAPDDPAGAQTAQVIELDNALGAMFTHLGNLAEALTVVVVSEFGRRASVNASMGTDHGAAFPMLVIGAGVSPGVKGTWPGLARDRLVDNDLRTTVDYRTVLAEVLNRRMGTPAADLASVFPRHRLTSSDFVGVCA